LFQKPVHIYNIRANRNPPGLKTQHLVGVQAVQKLTNGNLSKVEIGTSELFFIPGTSFLSNLDLDIKTAGSIGLIAQILQISVVISLNTDIIKINVIGGGTFGTGAPDPYYINEVTYHYFKKIGYNCKINVIKNGFYPKGGGNAEIILRPLKSVDYLRPLNLELQGVPLEIGGDIIASSNLQKPRVCERIRDEILLLSKTQDFKNPLSRYDLKNSIKIKYENTFSPGVGFNIWIKFDNDIKLGSGTYLGKIGVRSEDLARNAYRDLIDVINSGATIDNYCSDQIIPLVYLCNEGSIFRIPKETTHFKTNLELLSKFIKREVLIQKYENSVLIKLKNKF